MPASPALLDAALVWFRRDLRADDHAALHQALTSARQVWCAFVFDSDILDVLPRQDRRVAFIQLSLMDLNQQLTDLGAQHGRAGVGLIVRHGSALGVIPALAAQLGVSAVFTNHDDEPAALARDARVQSALAAQGVAFHTRKDHVVFERSELLTGAGKPYSVFTPYKNAWLKKVVDPFFLKPYPIAKHAAALAPLPTGERAGPPALGEIGFDELPEGDLKVPAGSRGAQALLADFVPRLDAYEDTRNFPSVKGPSYLSTHLRFGTVSIRHLAALAHARAQAGSAGAAVWSSELIWRDFYHQILHHQPHVVGHSFKPDYDRISWAEGPEIDALFAAWCEGRTGYPLVDAAMRQLNQTGYMHNRLRMVTASFLTKDLGVDWRRGEAYFALKLLDFDLAANNGGWQWAASTGCDAQPYFRIFNPVSQSEKFDAQGRFIRRYVPELAGLPDKAIHAPWEAGPIVLAEAGVRLDDTYPLPVVKHDEARLATLARFAVVKAGG